MAIEPPPTLNELNKHIRLDLTPDSAWEVTGEVHWDPAGNRWPVYRETVEVMERVPAMSPAGEPLWHLRPDGTRNRPMMTMEVVDRMSREFTYVPLGNGLAQKNYYFRPTPDEIAKKERENAEKRAISELGSALAEAGMSVVDFVKSVKDGAKAKAGIEPRPEPEAPPAPESDPDPAEGEYPRKYGVGLWDLSADHELARTKGEAKGFKGSQKEAVAAAEAGWPPPKEEE